MAKDKYEVKLFVLTPQIFIVEADNEDDAVDRARERFHNGEDADIPAYGETRIHDFDVEGFEAG